MAFKKISCEKVESILEIKLDSPENMNALTPTMLEELKDTFEMQWENKKIRAVTLVGSGDSFCVGADVSIFGKMLEEDKDKVQIELKSKFLKKLHSIITEIQRIPKPIVAGVNGPAVGAGLSLALACDITLISDKAFMSYAYTKIGLTGDGGSTFFLPRIVGKKKALDLAMRSPRISAKEAVDLGLASEVIPSENFRDSVRELGMELANGPTMALGLVKGLIRQSFDKSLESQLKDEEEAMMEAAGTSDFEEGVRAFLKKKAPHFKGN